MKTTDYKGAAGDPPIEKDKPSAREKEVQEARKHLSKKDREKPPPVSLEMVLSKASPVKTPESRRPDDPSLILIEVNPHLLALKRFYQRQKAPPLR